jgi:hypothetical protein
MKGVRVFPPPPKGFDALAATRTDLARHGLPRRPDPRKQPAVAALWEQRMRRYQGFEHLEPELLPADQPTEPVGLSSQGGHRWRSRSNSSTVSRGRTG